MAFAPWDGAAPAAGSDLRPPWWGPLTGRRLRPVLSGLGAAAVLLLAAKTFAYRLPAFAANHPYVEVEVLRRLDRELPTGAALGRML